MSKRGLTVALTEALRFQLAQLRRMTFGQSSEKLSLRIKPLELALDELEGVVEVAAVSAAAANRAERSAPVRSLPGHLPRIERRIEPETGACSS